MTPHTIMKRWRAISEEPNSPELSQTRRRRGEGFAKSILFEFVKTEEAIAEH